MNTFLFFLNFTLIANANFLLHDEYDIKQKNFFMTSILDIENIERMLKI